ncbi:hypothetical protein BXZ70DRAFT_129111 [Cristinia sonorae]|uniref:Uncharacterized protein n=1 Tax=Cristinia sonorae TaxID=1940300 RepID=A0A8K0UPV8_9AGAR|nr:hypothetical protein BXZ70DRAFT_129111 [Cristinia sonorae]
MDRILETFCFRLRSDRLDGLVDMVSLFLLYCSADSTFFSYLHLHHLLHDKAHSYLHRAESLCQLRLTRPLLCIMLSLKLLFYKLFNSITKSSPTMTSSLSDSAIFASSKPHPRPRSSTLTFCLGRRRGSMSPNETTKDAYRVDLLVYDQTISTVSFDDFDEETGTGSLVDIQPISEKSFSKVIGSKITWHGDAARTLDQCRLLNSVSPYFPLSSIALWEDTDLDAEDDGAYDWFGELPPVILTTGANSIFLRQVMPGLKMVCRSSIKSASPIPPSSAGFVQRAFAWFGR